MQWITSPELTGEMESLLSGVSEGTRDPGEYMAMVESRTRQLIDAIRTHDRSEFYREEAPVGTCGVCSSAVIETVYTYQCETNTGRGQGCDFTFWKDTSGRWFDRRTATRLLNDGTIDDLHGFFGRDGETFSVTAVMTSTGKVDVGVPVGDVEWTDDIVCPCPACESGTSEPIIGGMDATNRPARSNDSPMCDPTHHDLNRCTGSLRQRCHRLP